MTPPAEATDSRVAIVTGASRGIGRSIATRLASDGHHVVLVARSAGPLEELAAEIKAAGGAACAVPCDLSDGDAVTAMVEGGASWAMPWWPRRHPRTRPMTDHDNVQRQDSMSRLLRNRTASAGAERPGRPSVLVLNPECKALPARSTGGSDQRSGFLRLLGLEERDWIRGSSPRRS